MERITLCNTSEWNANSDDAITILVVDDDTTCLSIVAAILKKYRYEVVTVKHPKDALSTLRIKEFDLVVSDVHMPDMNGFELQQKIAQEFNLPVVLMSADNEERVALKGLERGAAFFILKPVCQDDLRDLWQFASLKKTSNQVVIHQETESLPSTEKNTLSESTSLVMNEAADPTTSKDSKRKSPQKEGSDDKRGENSQSAASQKKPKVIWTNSLHNRFLEAIRSIGLDRAVPKKILEVMNVPGLTRENVASHLQKYRIFLRRVSDASYKIQYSSGDKGLTSRPICELSSASTTLKKFNSNQFGTFSKLDISNNITQSGFGQSRLLSSRGWSWPPPNNSRFRHQNIIMQNDYHTPPRGLLAIANTRVSLEDVLSTSCLDAFPVTSNTITYDHAAPIVPKTNELNSDASNFRYKPNYVGYSIQNLTTRLRDTGKNDRLNLGGDQIPQKTNEHGDNQLGDGLLGDMINNRGQQLSSDEDYGMLSNPPRWDSCGVENDNYKLDLEYSFTPMFDMGELDMMMSTALQQPLELEDEEEIGGGFFPHDNQFNSQLNILNDHSQQKNGGETSANTNSNYYADLSQWKNPLISLDQSQNQDLHKQHQSGQGLLVPSQVSPLLNETTVQPIIKPQVFSELTTSPTYGATSSQLNKTVKPLTERDDDEFLESLLAPFGEDQTLEELIISISTDETGHV